MTVHTRGTTRGSGPRVHLSDLQQSFTVIAKLAMCLQPEFDQVSIAVLGPAGDLASWAQQGDLVGALDRLQYQLGEGPCIDSLLTADCIVATPLPGDERWRRYVPAATRLGLRSQVSAPLRWHDGEPLGALNMYSTTHARLGIVAPVVAEVLAGQVAGALVGFREVEHLHAAVHASTTIGRATGLLMAELEVDSDHALAHLRRASAVQSRKLIHVADEVVRTRRLPD